MTQISTTPTIRVPKGNAVLMTKEKSSVISTDPENRRDGEGGATNDWGKLQINNVIHATGPSYTPGENTDVKNEKDKILKGAYTGSLILANTARARGEDVIKNIGFCLLSSGVFRGDRTLEDVIKIGVYSIFEYLRSIDSSDLENIYIYSYEAAEKPILEEIFRGLLV